MNRPAGTLLDPNSGIHSSAPTSPPFRHRLRQTIKIRANHFVHHHQPQQQTTASSSHSCRVLDEHYRLGPLLGQGGFGAVHACTHIQSGAERAVKIIETSALSDEEQANVVKEFQILKDLDHPNILKMYEMMEDAHTFYLVTDVYEGGELYQAITERGGFSETDAALVIQNVLGCINYCHHHCVVHRDLKPENILLASNSNNSQDGSIVDPKDIRIIDFGLAKQCVVPTDFSVRNLHKKYVFSEVAGSPYYISPQVLVGRYTNKCDVWAIGVITFVLLGGYPPFAGETTDEILQSIDEGKVEFTFPIWTTISDPAKEFIQYLLAYDEEDRPTAEEALRHPWFASRETATSVQQLHTSVRASLHALQQHSQGPAFGKLKQAVCAYIASQLLPRQPKEDIDLLFRALDEDSNGHITEEDISHWNKEAFGDALSDSDIKGIVKATDFSSSGAIEYSEFVIAVMIVTNMVNQQNLQAAFDHFDVDQTGYITMEGLKRVLNLEDNMENYIVNSMIRPADADGDGKISMQDFERIMGAPAQRRQQLRRSSKRGVFRTLCPQPTANCITSMGLDSVMEGLGLEEK